MKQVFKKVLFLFLLLEVILTVYAEEISVIDTLSDSLVTLLPGVSVLIKDIRTRIDTDFDGKFTLKANQDSVLV